MKTVLITGASGGIGSACARLFHGKGFFAALHCNTHRDRAEQLCRELGEQACVVQADLTRPEEVDAMFATLRQTCGSPTVLVNNAGICFRKMLADTSPEEWNRVLAANLTSAYLCIHAALPDMMYSGGSVVNVTSYFGQAGGSCEAAYSAAKAGLTGLTRALAREVPTVRFNCVSPGVVETPMNAALTQAERAALAEEIPAGRFASPEEIASAVFFAATQPYLTGQEIAVNGGIYM